MAGQTDPSGTNDLALRLTDDERARAAGVLDAAVTDGRLTWTEYSERSGLVWAARTRGDLGPHLADLGELPPPAPPTQRVLAVLSKVSRSPEPEQLVHARAVFGAVILDFSRMRPGEQVQVEASSWCAKVIIYVAEDASVIDDGTVLFGKRALVAAPSPPGGPMVRITGRSTLGHLRVHRGHNAPWHHSGQHAFPGHLIDGHVHLHHDRHLHLHHDEHIHLYGHHGHGKWHKRDKRRKRWGHHPPPGYW